MSDTSENQEELRINILKTASQNYDHNLLKYNDFFKTIKFYKYKITNSDVEKSKIYLYDINKELIIDLDFDITMILRRDNYIKMSNRSHYFHNNARDIMIKLNDYSMKEWFYNVSTEHRLENIRLLMDNDLLVYYNVNDLYLITSIISHYIKKNIFLYICIIYNKMIENNQQLYYTGEMSDFYEFSYFPNYSIGIENLFYFQITILNEDKLDNFIKNNENSKEQTPELNIDSDNSIISEYSSDIISSESTSIIGDDDN